MWPDEESFIAEMVASGCVIEVEHGDDGPVLTWDMERTKELYPEVAAIVEDAFNREVKGTLLGMVDDGLLEMSFEETEDGGIEEVFFISEEGKEVLSSMESDKFMPFDTDALDTDDDDVVE